MKAALKFVIGMILFGVILYFVDWHKTLRVFATTDATLSLLAVALITLNMFISTWKWQVLLHGHSLMVSFHESLRAYWVGTFFNNYLPSNVGGDFVRLVMLRRLNRSAEVAASIVLERLSGFAILLVLAAIGLTMRPHYFDIAGLLPLLWVTVLAGAGLLVALTVFNRRLDQWLSSAGSADRTTVQRLAAKLRKVTTAIEHYRDNKGVVLLTLLLSIPFYVVLIAFQFLILIAVGADLPPLDVVAIAPIIPLISLIPISINGLGLTEGAFVLFYTQAGVLPEQALAAAVLRRVFNLLVSLVGGVYWAAYRPKQM